MKGIHTVHTVVASVDTPAAGIRRLVLTDPDHWPLPPFKPGAHLDLHLGPGLVRTYSLCNAPSDHRRYVVAVKHEPAGRGGSDHIHTRLQPGDAVGVSLPRGGLSLTTTGRNLFIAGGIGVTPFLSALRHVHDGDGHGRGAPRPDVHLHWLRRGEPCLLDDLAPALQAGQLSFHDTRRTPAPRLADLLAGLGPDDRAFCCGPDTMLDAFEAATADWSPERRHVERFTAPVPAPIDGARPYRVVLAKSKRSALVEPGVGLVATLQALDIEVPVSCGGGICGACRVRWTAGEPVHRDRVLSPDERRHELMACVAGCASDALTLDL
jgi:ferredoxin-NADP reductase